MGNDDSSPTYGASSTAAATWYDYMYAATEGMPVEEFPDVPEVDGRDGTIKAEPITPGRISESDYVGPDRDAQEGDGYDSGSSWSDPSVDSGGGYYEEPAYSEEPSGSASSEPAPAEAAPAEAAPAAAEPAPADPVAPVAPISEPPPVVVPIEPVEPAAPPPVMTKP
jgi:penicillin-binding protein 1A